jgi:hypothetical protein
MVLRCTAKTLKLLGVRPGDLVTVEHTDQDWYANLLWLDGRKCRIGPYRPRLNSRHSLASIGAPTGAR